MKNYWMRRFYHQLRCNACGITFTDPYHDNLTGHAEAHNTTVESLFTIETAQS